MTVLGEGQWAIDDLVFGPGTDINLSTFEWGAPQLTVSDTPTPRGDGVSFGRDYRGSRTLTLELNVLGSDYGVLDRLSVLESAWMASRYDPDTTSVISYRLGGRTRRVYGRPRRFATDSLLAPAGRVDVTCDFATKDHLFYSDDESAELVPFVPNAVGGLIGPQVGGWAASTSGDSSGNIVVAGSSPSWLVWRVQGPIVNPEIEVVGRWKARMNTTVNYDQFVSVDPSPWNRSVRRNDGANFSGAFTADSVRLSEMQVPPGSNQVILRGIDPTGSSSVQVFWRDVYASY